MPTHRVPVFVWRDAAGFFTAVPVDPGLAGWDAAALDSTAERAMAQLQSYLEWLYRESPYAVQSDFLDPELVHVRVSVRPQYREQERIYPCEEEIELRVPCVCGRQEGGLAVCALPTFGIGFHFFQRGELKRMVAEAVRRLLDENTPQQIARYLPPAAARLDDVFVRVWKVLRRDAADADLPSLSQVAQAIGQPGFRKRFASPWQRDQELADLIQRLGAEKANVLLVGDHGAGKSTLLVAAVRSLERTPPGERASRSDDDPPRRPRHRHWLTTAARLIAGMRYLGEWQKRCESVIGELSSIGGVLCVENLLDLVLMGGSGPAGSIAAFLQLYLQTGQLRLVAEATAEELEACRRLLPGFVEVFQVLRLPVMEPAKARAALASVAAARGQETKVAAEPLVHDAVHRLFRRFMPYHAMPGRAARFLAGLFDQAKENGQAEIRLTDVFQRFIRQSGLPEAMLRDDHLLRAEEVEKWLDERIIGQPDACRTMAELIATFKAGLNDPRRPLGTLLFCGPTGVGKTELAKTVASYLFGHGKQADRLVRLDMSEYGLPWSAERLVAKADRTPSEFIQRLRQQPFSVVLLDEIEKASAEVFDLLLGALDEGRLTDRYGRTTTLQSAIIIMTSNLGSAAGRSVGFAPAGGNVYEAEAQAFFRPEFFNRIDAVVSFRPLNPEVCTAIVRKELAAIGIREGLTAPGIRLWFSTAAVARLVQLGFDARYGARPLQRILETEVVAAISRFLVGHPGIHDTEIRVDVDASGNVTLALTPAAPDRN